MYLSHVNKNNVQFKYPYKAKYSNINTKWF